MHNRKLPIIHQRGEWVIKYIGHQWPCLRFQSLSIYQKYSTLQYCICKILSDVNMVLRGRMSSINSITTNLWYDANFIIQASTSKAEMNHPRWYKWHIDVFLCRKVKESPYWGNPHGLCHRQESQAENLLQGDGNTVPWSKLTHNKNVRITHALTEFPLETENFHQ